MDIEQPQARKRRRAFLGGLALAGATIGALIPMGRTRAADNDGYDQIVGTWLTVNLTTTTRVPGFAFILYFMPAGIFQYTGPSLTTTANANDDPMALEYRSVGGGQWLRTGFNEYVISLVTALYDPQGAAIGINHNKGIVRYDPIADTIAGELEPSVQRDLRGQQVSMGWPAIYEAKRVTVR